MSTASRRRNVFLFYVLRVTQTLVLLCRSRWGRTVPQHGLLPSAATVPASSEDMLRVLAYSHLTNTSYLHTFIRVQNTHWSSSIWSFYCFIVILSLTRSFCSLSQPFPKPVLHKLRSSAFCFSLQDPLVSLRSFRRCLRLLPHLLVTSVLPAK